MKGVCKCCGSLDSLRGCGACGSAVCHKCVLANGWCKLCRGRKEAGSNIL